MTCQGVRMKRRANGKLGMSSDLGALRVSFWPELGGPGSTLQVFNLFISSLPSYSL